MTSLAQYAGPGVETCRAYAEREVRSDSSRAQTVAFDRDRELNIERYTRKIGSQFVSSLLYGNGAIVLGPGPAIEMSFLCLLADEKRAVFFHWTPRRDAPSLAQCRRNAAAREEPGACLDVLLQTVERDLTQAYALRFQEARERDAVLKNEEAVAAFRKAADAWRSYRDAECARRTAASGGGSGAADAQKACVVELTRRRALDLQ
ncbi:MAG: DUF1311 domain-containing protein [Burkholderiales bacterium]|nr:DUF1311 domain-containing protein [Burkholderiales bacterium]